ncbi:MAG: helix-turn-helix domain-containing protein [Veillonella sp.]|nr:helix-turn-helix domain-containing protein [Veillonella sp.]
MKVSVTVAQNIVESMKTIIKQDINFIDTDGTIIASTDPQRVGTYHEGALTVVKTNQMLIVSPEDTYEGTRPGINVPVHVNGETIAVIGITGDPQQVMTYGNILRKMTEILVLEDEVRTLQQRDAERSRMLVEDLLFYGDAFGNRWDATIEAQWLLDEGLKRVCIIKVEAPQFNVYKDLRHQLNMAFDTANIALSKRSVLWMEHEQLFVVLYKLKSEKMLRRILEEALASVPAVTIAYGSAVHQDFKKSYQDALLTLQNGPLVTTAAANGAASYEYEKLTIELLINDTNKDRQLQLVDKVLGALSQKEIAEFKHILQLFGEHNGSVSVIAEELFIHKNTLQYQIQKLKRLTGYDMRHYDDYMVLKLAFMLHSLFSKGVAK